MFSKIHGFAALALLGCTTTCLSMGIAEVSACYVKAGDDVLKINACLKNELTVVKAEHKDVSERVTVIAKRMDRQHGNRTLWNKFMRANSGFNSYLKRECDFVGRTTRGNANVEKNAELACQINLYRMRIDMLENHYLSASKM